MGIPAKRWGASLLVTICAMLTARFHSTPCQEPRFLAAHHSCQGCRSLAAHRRRSRLARPSESTAPAACGIDGSKIAKVEQRADRYR